MSLYSPSSLLCFSDAQTKYIEKSATRGVIEGHRSDDNDDIFRPHCVYVGVGLNGFLGFLGFLGVRVTSSTQMCERLL